MDKMKLLDDFLLSTEAWHGQFENPGDACPFCGMVPDNLLALADAIRILKDKAYRYDSVSK